MRFQEFSVVSEGYKEVSAKFADSTDQDTITSTIARFKELVNKNQVSGNERNIDWWGKQGWDKFQLFVNAKFQQKTQTQQKSRKSVGNSHVLDENNDWLIVVPLDKDASCFHGKDTDWCTTKPDESHFESYFRDKLVTLIYFLHKKSGNKWAIAHHPYENTFFNKNDTELTQVKFDRVTGLNSQTYLDMIKSGTSAEKYATSARTNMQYQLDELRRLLDEHSRLGKEKRNIQIETLLLTVKSTIDLRVYMNLISNDKSIELDQTMQTLVLSLLPFMMERISNLTEKTSRMAVKKDTNFIRYISNPSESVISHVIQTNPFMIKHIKDPSLSTITMALNINSHVIFSLGKKITTENAIIATELWLNSDDSDEGPDRTPNGNVSVTDLTSWLDSLESKITISYEYYKWFMDTVPNGLGANAIAMHFLTNDEIFNDQIKQEIIQLRPEFKKIMDSIE